MIGLDACSILVVVGAEALGLSIPREMLDAGSGRRSGSGRGHRGGGSRIRGRSRRGRRSRGGRRRSGSKGSRDGQSGADEGESKNAELHFDDRVVMTGT